MRGDRNQVSTRPSRYLSQTGDIQNHFGHSSNNSSNRIRHHIHRRRAAVPSVQIGPPVVISCLQTPPWPLPPPLRSPPSRRLPQFRPPARFPLSAMPPVRTPPQLLPPILFFHSPIAQAVNSMPLNRQKQRNNACGLQNSVPQCEINPGCRQPAAGVPSVPAALHAPAPLFLAAFQQAAAQRKLRNFASIAAATATIKTR